MGSILSEIKGSMTGFEKLTPELVEKLSCDGLTYDELKEAMQKSGLSIDRLFVIQQEFFKMPFSQIMKMASIVKFICRKAILIN